MGVYTRRCNRGSVRNNGAKQGENDVDPRSTRLNWWRYPLDEDRQRREGATREQACVSAQKEAGWCAQGFCSRRELGGHSPDSFFVRMLIVTRSFVISNVLNPGPGIFTGLQHASPSRQSRRAMRVPSSPVLEAGLRGDELRLREVE